MNNNMASTAPKSMSQIQPPDEVGLDRRRGRFPDVVCRGGIQIPQFQSFRTHPRVAASFQLAEDLLGKLKTCPNVPLGDPSALLILG
jgi:hypothetical protein